MSFPPREVLLNEYELPEKFFHFYVAESQWRVWNCFSMFFFCCYFATSSSSFAGVLVL